MHLITLRLPFPPGATDAQKEELKNQAESIITDVKRGMSFSEAAKKYSITPTDVGFVSQADLDPRLAEYLDKLKPKEMAPVVTPGGFQLVQMVARRSGEPRPFNEVAPEIRRILTQKDIEKEFGEWVKTLREKAHIKILL
jgi:parvulin-like peptidyl-prolyl isomerase